MSTSTANPDDVTLRRWLTHLGQPDRLAEPDLVAVLVSRELVDHDATPRIAGQVAAQFLLDAIERLRPVADSPGADSRPYDVLRTCFVDRMKLGPAATQLAMSRRQLSRERARAFALLREELRVAARRDVPAGASIRIPAILDFLPRPAERNAISDTLSKHNLVHVHGPPGIGKTCLVADIVVEAEKTRPVLWHRFRPKVNESIGSFIFELGEFLHAHGRSALARHLAGGLPHIDLGMLSRIALKELSDVPLLLVLDDYQLVDADDAITGFVAELALRCPRVRIVTVGRHRPIADDGAGSVGVPPLSRRATEAMLAKLGVPVDTALAQTLHRWTGGTPQLVRLTASWLKGATPAEVARGTSSLEDLEEVQHFLLDNITELLGTDDRAVLAAASTFRDRFTDDALAFVADRTRGQVQDSSRRLVRYYVAVRGRAGDVAFLHASVRNYVHDRLSHSEHRQLHLRAASWYDRNDLPAEAEHHSTHAKAAPA